MCIEIFTGPFNRAGMCLLTFKIMIKLESHWEGFKKLPSGGFYWKSIDTIIKEKNNFSLFM